MKYLRFLIIGIVLGGGFGAKLGAYFSQVFEQTANFQLVEFGFALGAGLGLLMSIVIQVMHSGVFKGQNAPTSSPAMTYSS